MNTLCKLILIVAFAAMIASPQFVPSNPAPPAKPPETPVVTVSRAALAIEKFAACIAPNPDVNISLKDAREVVSKLAADAFNVRGGLWCNEMKTGAVGAYAVPESDLVGAGWPETVPLNLTIKGNANHHSVAAIKKQMDYGWAYWWFAKRWVSYWW